MPLVTSVTVKVMRSFDYCHFEIVLGAIVILKAYDDENFRANRRYSYEDDWQDDEEE